jgi:hypothetical protein
MLYKEAIKWAVKKVKPKPKKKRISASEKRKQKEDKLGKAIIGASIVGGPPAVVGAGYLGQKRRDRQVKDKNRANASKSRKNKPEMYPPPKNKKSLAKKMKAIAEKIPTTESYKRKKRNKNVVTGVGRKPTYKDRD